jgi:hypothetical protein
MSDNPELEESAGPTLDLPSKPEPLEAESARTGRHSGRRRRHHHHHHHTPLKDIARLVGGGLMVGCVLLLGLAAWTEDAVVFQLGVRGTMVLASILIALDGARAVYESLRRGKRRAALLKGVGYLVALIVVVAILRHLLLS